MGPTPGLQGLEATLRKAVLLSGGGLSSKGKKAATSPLPSLCPLARLLLALFISLAGMTLVEAGGKGTSTANFLKIGVGARAVAMGEAYTAAADDAFAPAWNPAGLSRLNYQEIGFMHNEFIQDVRYEYLSYARPMPDRGTFAGSLSYVTVGDIQGYDPAGGATGKLSASDLVVAASWGYPWTVRLPGLDTGVTLKLLNKRLDQQSATGIMADLGFRYQLPRPTWMTRLHVGGVAQHLGPGLKFIRETSPTPRTFKLGLAGSFLHDSLLVAWDLALPRDNSLLTAFGAEYRFRDLLALRMGYKTRDDLDRGLSYGIGLGNSQLHLDYAFVPFGILGQTHRVSLGVRFGPTLRRDRFAEEVEQRYQAAERAYGQAQMVDAYVQLKRLASVAPWHQPTQKLLARITEETETLGEANRRQQLETGLAQHFTQGVRYFNQDDLLKAKDEFETILALSPHHAGAKEYLGKIQDRYQGLVQAFLEIAEKDLKEGRLAEAKQEVEKALVLDPQHEKAKTMFAQVTERLTQEEATRQQEARETAIKKAYRAGEKAYAEGNLIQALEYFQQVVRFDPTHPAALSQVATILQSLAENAYQEGYRLERAGQTEEAIRYYQRAVHHQPAFVPAKEALARLQGEQREQRRAESRKLYQQGLEAAMVQDFATAQRLWQRALELDPENLEARRSMERINRSTNGNGTRRE
ncbi:MAG: PorV/PorQ family protein [Elusimicrobia bacterium]|nr:PorV/PorQ family protein [Elusimicrobiota bacterium]